MEQKDFMVNEHGIVVECAYDNLKKKLDDYVSTPVKEKKDEYMFNAFKEFMDDLKK